MQKQTEFSMPSTSYKKIQLIADVARKKNETGIFLANQNYSSTCNQLLVICILKWLLCILTRWKILCKQLIESYLLQFDCLLLHSPLATFEVNYWIWLNVNHWKPIRFDHFVLASDKISLSQKRDFQSFHSMTSPPYRSIWHRLLKYEFILS